MKIPVRKSHIRRGEQGMADYCPIALAIEEYLRYGDIEVNRTWAKVGKFKFKLPPNAVKFISKFDDKKSSVKPFILEI